MTASADSSPPSPRPITDIDAPWVRNLAALWASDPKLARAIERIDPKSGYPIEPTRSGDVTVSVRRSDGKAIHLHSKYEPVAEATKLVESLDAEKHQVFHILGLGLGYHVEALFAKASEEAILCVYEHDLAMVRTAMEARDLSEMLRSKRVMIFTDCQKADLFIRMNSHIAITSLGSVVLAHPPSVSRKPDFYEEVRSNASQLDAFCSTSISTLVLNGRRTAENISRNLGWYAASPGIERLKNRYKGKPGIIVSAGPSLRKNKHHLKDAQGKAVLIATQTMLKPLLEMGLEPQFVTSLDYHDICTRFFENLPPTLSTELVAEPKATSKIFSMNPGPVSLLGSDFADKMLKEIPLNKPRLPAGATVAHLAYYLAEFMGCDPIIFVGQDLGFSDGLCYAPGTSYEDVWRPELSRFCTMEMKQWEHIAQDRPVLRKIEDHEGRAMYTEERLYTYLQQFERDFAQTNRTIIDATEGGAKKRGAAPMKLIDAIRKYCTASLGQVPRDYPGLRWEILQSCIQCVRNRRSDAAQIEQISTQTLPLLEQVYTLLKNENLTGDSPLFSDSKDAAESSKITGKMQGKTGDSPRFSRGEKSGERTGDCPWFLVNRAIGEIDALRARMFALDEAYELIVQITQSTEINRFQRDRQITASKVSGVERQRRQVQRDIDNVKGVIDAAKQFQTLCDEVIAHLEQLARQTSERGKAA